MIRIFDSSHFIPHKLSSFVIYLFKSSLSISLSFLMSGSYIHDASLHKELFETNSYCRFMRWNISTPHDVTDRWIRSKAWTKQHTRNVKQKTNSKLTWRSLVMASADPDIIYIWILHTVPYAELPRRAALDAPQPATVTPTSFPILPIWTVAAFNVHVQSKHHSTIEPRHSWQRVASWPKSAISLDLPSLCQGLTVEPRRAPPRLPMPTM